VESTNGDGPGFLWDDRHSFAFSLGMWKPRACRWCGFPLEPDGTLQATFLFCTYCDDHDPADECECGDTDCCDLCCDGCYDCDEDY